jgi:hypothetical protein
VEVLQENQEKEGGDSMKVGDLVSFSYKSNKNSYIMSKVYLAIAVKRRSGFNNSSPVEVTMFHPCGRISRHDQCFLMVVS